MSAVRFALIGNFGAAVLAILAAAVLDSLDGRLARLLDATSKMGAELDSLADAISFGVAPALVLYIWVLSGNRHFGWTAALLFAVCTVLRLARFNTLMGETSQRPFEKEFFVGVPAPGGAILAVIPVALTLQFGSGWWSSGPVVAGWLVVVAILMVSRLPTLSMKAATVPTWAIVPLLALVVVITAAVVTRPFLALTVAGLIYLTHVPYAAYRHSWLARHPEEWHVPARERQAIRRRNRGPRRRTGLRAAAARVRRR